MQTQMVSPEINAFLLAQKSKVLTHSGTQHPFLQAFAENGLPPAACKEVFLEVLHLFKDYPFYLSILAGRLFDLKVLQEVIRILSDEVAAFNGKPHLDIYQDFLRIIGNDDASMAAHQPLKTSLAMNACIQRNYLEQDTAVGVGSLFALETMASDMMNFLNRGLAASGFDAEQRYFFEIHVELEKEHSDESFSAAIPILSNGGPEQVREKQRLFAQGLDDFMNTLSAFWSGIAAQYAGKYAGNYSVKETADAV